MNRWPKIYLLSLERQISQFTSKNKISCAAIFFFLLKGFGENRP